MSETNELENKLARELAKRDVAHNRKCIADIDREIGKLRKKRAVLESEIERITAERK